MPTEKPTSPPPPAPEPTPPFDPTDPNRFRLTPEQWARVAAQARQLIQLSGMPVNPITPTPQKADG